MVPTTHPLARNELAARSLTLAGIATSWFGTWPQLEQGHIIIAATIALLAVSSTAASADCSVKPAIVALAAPLDELKPIERSASVRRSEEGGSWLIYRGKIDGAATIVRIDFGETVRVETRLSAVDQNNFGISETDIEYAAPIYDPDYPGGPEFRRTTTNYYYCDGRLSPMTGGHLTAEQMKNFERHGAELLKLMLFDLDVADFHKSLER